MVHFWLRAEVKEGERRTPLLATGAAELIKNGHKVSVERCEDRCVKDKEYEDAGCTMVEGGSWEKAPKQCVILGLKEIPEENDKVLSHQHIFFGHCYKQQAGWKELLARFRKGNGLLMDMEFLVDDNGRRVAAFGRSAGFIGAAVGTLAWVVQHEGDGGAMKGPVPYHDTWDELASVVKARVDTVCDGDKVKRPRAHVIGALGRCGRGAVDLFERANIEVIKWDMEETKAGGPFSELLDSEIVVNCILLDAKNPPKAFLTRGMLQNEKRRLRSFVDVSCDTTNPTNPVPIYDTCTTIKEPTTRLIESTDTQAPLDVVAIDHLPSLVPLESSNEYATALLPHLHEYGKSKLWERARKLFDEKVIEANQTQ